MSQNEGCTRCASLEARITQLEHENAILRAWIAYLQTILQRIVSLVNRVIAETDIVLSGHHPRGTWSIYRGRREVAVAVKNRADGH